MRWTLKEEPKKHITTILEEKLAVPHSIARLLALRGITDFETAKTFFRPHIDMLHDPFLMQDMDKAVIRLNKALENNEQILIYGDYDVDGTTAVSLVYSYLTSFYENVHYYIPDRYDEGYGISFKSIDFAKDNGFSLIIALDCGIKALDKVAYANEKHIDYIICDHHRPGKEIPNAVAVLDQKRVDCNYPYKELSGCGIGFKFMQAFHQKKDGDIMDLIPLLDLVATSIGADIVPITGENRVLATLGLDVINKQPRIGIQALMKQVKKDYFTITDVVFVIAPRINAAGRIKHGKFAVALLIENDLDKALEFAQEIEVNNADRKDLDKQITAEALAQIEKNQEENNASTVVYQADWHKGVIGIVASRLIETHYKPTVVFTKNNTKLAASVRSVSGFDVYNALSACKEHIEQFGGHKYAAGLTLQPEKYLAFKQAFEQTVRDTLPEALKTKEQRIDAQITLAEITPKLWRIIKQFAPFGPGNMKPVFIAYNLQDTGYGKAVGDDKTHLKIKVSDKTIDYGIDAIGFNLGDKINLIKNKKYFDAVFQIDENTWQGKTSLQLRLIDIKASELFS
jgi:single-stranded-DNA-specific exonuclease